jgi:hypothetical protein
MNDLKTFIEPTAQIKKIISLKLNKEKAGELNKMVIDFTDPDAPQISLICEKITADYKGKGIKKFILQKIKSYLDKTERNKIVIDFNLKTIVTE